MSSSLTYGYTFDTTGSVIQRHHIGGATYADYATCYDAFGAQLGSYNNGGFVANTQDAVGWAGQWGGYTDQATAAFGSGSSPIIRYPLVLLGHRYYDPGAGRFLNRDPVGMEGGVNVYAYCTNNPVNLTDPLGLWEVSVGGFTFDGDVVSEGLKTGLAAVASQFSGGLYDGGRFRNNAGFDGAKHCAQVADAALTATGVVGLGKKIAIKVAARSAAKLAAKAGVCSAGKVSLVAKLLRTGKTLCFVAGTPVQMTDGTTKPIEQIKIGDYVQSRDPNTGVTTAKQVTQTSAHTADATLTLTFSNGEAIQTTPTHPFYVLGRGFVQANQLGIGTSIVTRAGPAATLTARTNHTGSVRVYNFEVADFHTYFVGKSDGGLWVHNSGGCVPAIARTIGIVERDGDVVRIVGNGPNGAIEVIASMKREGARIILSGAHIDGPGAGKMGIRELSAFAKQFGRNENVKEIIIEGAKRTTGARPGHVPRPFTFSVD